MAEDITDAMSLEDKIGQMFITSLYSLDEGDTKSQQSVTSQMKKTIGQYSIGGVVLFSRNMKDSDQTKELISNLQDTSDIPLFAAVDEEGDLSPGYHPMKIWASHIIRQRKKSARPMTMTRLKKWERRRAAS